MAEPVVIASFLLGSAVRIIFSGTDLASWVANRPEVTTPINAWKRVEEGLSLHESNMSFYSGDLIHETPLMLKLFQYTTSLLSGRHYLLFVAADALSGLLLYHIACLVAVYLLKKQERQKDSYHKESQNLRLTYGGLYSMRVHVIAIHFFNPYSIAACLAQSTSVISNLSILLTIYYMMRGCLVRTTIFLAVSTYQSVYPLVLLFPVAIHLFKSSHPDASLTGWSAVRFYAAVTGLASIFTLTLLYVSYLIAGSSDFINATYGFIWTVPDLTPNIGLFWYFFTEMFEHFRLFFLYVFQINVFIYTVPLTVKLADHPLFLLYTQIFLICIFKSYPSYSDTALYLSLLPLWTHLFSYMRNSFVVSCMFPTCTVIAPILWHLWIYSGSANANFFFAVTLAFTMAQIFLLTDLVYAFLRREFDLVTGPKATLPNGRAARVVLK